MFVGPDISYIQGDYIPTADFVIINSSRANIGPTAGSFYHQQVDNAIARGVDRGDYFFNGRATTVIGAADFYVDNLYRFEVGKNPVLLDVESTGTVAYNPEESLVWLAHVCGRLGYALHNSIIYLNEDLLRVYGSRWQPLVDAGVHLWLAWPGPESGIYTGVWPTWTIWQNTIINGVDHNISKMTLASIAALAAPTPPPTPFYKKKKKVTMFGFISAPNGEISIVYGDGPNAGKRRPLHLGEWIAYVSQGYTANAVTAAQYAQIPALDVVG